MKRILTQLDETKSTIERSRLETIRNRLQASAPFLALTNRINTNVLPRISLTGLNGSASALLVDLLLKQLDRPILLVTSSAEEAADLYDDLAFLTGETVTGHFPARQILPYDFRAPVGEIMGRRLSALSCLLDGRLRIIVCPIRALVEPTILKAELIANRVELTLGAEYDLGDLTLRLTRLGFRRVPLVEEVGDFAVRGGLVDFFTPGFDAPVRVEFFGDEVDTIRTFEVSTQRTIKRMENVTLLPKRETAITQETIESHLEHLNESDSEYIRARYLNDPELPGLEWLSVMFDQPQGRLCDYLPERTILFFHGQGALRTEIDSILKEGWSLYERLKPKINDLPTPDKYYLSESDLFETLKQFAQIDQFPFRGGKPDIIDFGCQPPPSLASRLDLVGKTLEQFAADNVACLITVDSAGQAERLAELIEQKGETSVEPAIEVADLKAGFVCKRYKYAILTDHEIFSRYHRRVRRKKFKEGIAISDYSSLTKGDYVVHTEYGIARYLGLETLTIDNRQRDCLLLRYANSDKLYVPIEEFNRVSKYSGKDAGPSLTSLGGTTWEKIKKRTKKAVDDMAADLLKLYAERKTRPGYSFGEDTVWLHQLEASFPFEETPDQLKAINDVKRDMAADQPMDRLICGDVGYGKTEVAVRAAFKAIENGKQVAVLVPTTILAQQHLQTFGERLNEFPVKVEMLSRFRTRSQQLEILKQLNRGAIDLVIGTHRLLSKDVAFKNLGLLIIDEEHRFGVGHKEKLRQLKASVDTISLTATPIPRTLHMAMSGVRDISIIGTSPKDRLPILTEIAEFDPSIIATAILREIDRGGQVFFVHNRVQTIDAMHRYLTKIVPQAKITVAHGQMHEKSLESIMMAFMSRQFDVLLCTSIIESGLDIPSANTIIINRADRFGLAQLYQIRGRVGRSSMRAYAYLIAPKVKLLRADAIKRLRALEAHSDLGSGFALAMRDLEIRGAGTVLGTKQSGHIEEVGYDLYNKLLEEAITKLRGEEPIRLPDSKLEIDIETHLSNEYISDRQQKVDIYRRLADSKSLDDVDKLRDEVVDRFGKLPPSGENLFHAVAVKISAAALELRKVIIRRGIVNLIFRKGRKLTRSEVEAFGKGTSCPLEFSVLETTTIEIDMREVDESDRLMHLRGLLGKIG